MCILSIYTCKSIHSIKQSALLSNIFLLILHEWWCHVTLTLILNFFSVENPYLYKSSTYISHFIVIDQLTRLREYFIFVCNWMSNFEIKLLTKFYFSQYKFMYVIYINSPRKFIIRLNVNFQQFFRIWEIFYCDGNYSIELLLLHCSIMHFTNGLIVSLIV